MINSYEQVFKANPTKGGDLVALTLTYGREVGYFFHAQRFAVVDGKRWHDYRTEYSDAEARKHKVFITYPCSRQSKKRYQEAKESAFAYIHSDAGVEELRAAGIELLEFVGEREWDCYA